MGLLNPYGWLLLLSLPILYLLSRNNKEIRQVTVSSLKLWTVLLESNKPKKELKHAANWLFLIQCLMVIIACLGLVDLYKEWTEDDLIVLLYDRSFSTQSIYSHDQLETFIKAHEKKDFQIVLMDTASQLEASLLSGSECLDFIKQISHTQAPLDVALLVSTYESYKKNNQSVMVVSDKSILEGTGIEGDNLMILPANHKNMGIRQASYNPRSQVLSIVLENDSQFTLGQDLVLFNRELVLYERSIILGPKEVKVLKIPAGEFDHDLNNREEISNGKGNILTIRLSDNDSLLADNTFYCPYVKTIGVSLEDGNQTIEKLLDLIPYTVLLKENTNYHVLMDANRFNHVPRSDVTYEDSFIKAVASKGLKDLSVIRSPYYPLWIEDHLYQAYVNYVETLVKNLPVNNPPASYLINRQHIPVTYETNHAFAGMSKKSNKSLSMYYFFMAFIILMFIEEEVRRYV